MKHLFKLIIGMFVIIFLSSSAMGAGLTKIAVVDIQQFQKKSIAFQKTRGVFKKKFELMQKKLDQERRELRKIEEDLKKQSMMLSLDAQENKMRDLEKKRRYVKYLFEDFTKEAKYAEIEATKKIQKELTQIVKKIGQKEGYLLILEKGFPGFLYSDDSIDITDQVIETYDKTKQ